MGQLDFEMTISRNFSVFEFRPAKNFMSVRDDAAGNSPAGHYKEGASFTKVSTLETELMWIKLSVAVVGDI